MVKRGFDMALSALALIVCAPLFLLLAVLIKRDSAGPVLFKQTRVGRFGHPFEILKFRTMSHGLEEAGLAITVAQDARVTDVGRVLRQYKLDELPQLFNVLKGDMSLVGPRPEVPRYVAMYTDEQKAQVLSVRPGITDNASIEFRNEGDILAATDDPEKAYIQEVLPVKIRLYQDYVAHHSLWNDLLIILRTLLVIVKR